MATSGAVALPALWIAAGEGSFHHMPDDNACDPTLGARMFTWGSFFASLVVGLVGVTVSVVATITYNSRAERRRLQVDCARQLFRWSIGNDEYFRAFNEAPIIFSNAPEVLAAHQKVLDTKELMGEEMTDFLLSVAKAIGMTGASRQQMVARFGLKKKD